MSQGNRRIDSMSPTIKEDCMQDMKKKLSLNDTKDFVERKKKKISFYWKSVVQEVLNKNNKAYSFYFTDVPSMYPDTENHDFSNGALDQKNSYRQQKKKKNYYLQEGREGVYFTRREAECMVHCMHGKTIPGAAESLGLSPRTVEFYLKNMKVKLNCRTKSQLIEKVTKSYFLKNVDFLDEIL